MATPTSVSGPAASGGEPPIPQIVQSAAKTLDKNLFSISTQLRGGTPTPILPSAASVQLAQLQAQLTLQRLKFAQSAVNSNTAAATVLNQVLTKVAMSQPLFNTLSAPTLINAAHRQAGGAPLGPGMPGPGMPPGGLHYPPQTPGLVAGGMSHGGSLQPQNPGPIRLNPFGGMVPQPSGAVMSLNKPVSSHLPGGFSEYPGNFSNKTNVPNNHTYMHDEVLCTQGFHQFGFGNDMSNVLSANLASGNPVNGQHILNQPHAGFQRDFQNSQGQQMCRMPAPGYSGEMNAGGFPPKPEGFHQVNPAGNSQNQGPWAPDQWQNSSPFWQPNRPDFAAQSQNVWSSKGQPLQMRSELYNPEEPTSEGRLNIGCPPHFNRFNNNNNNQSFTGPQFNQSDKQPQGAFHPHPPERQIQPHELNDFHGLVPSQLPHICSICDKKVFNLKDWEHHVNGKHHIQNCTLFSENSGIGPTNFTRSTNGGVNSCGTSTSLNLSDLPSDGSQAHLRTFPQPSHGFSSPPSGSKLFPQRKPGPSRVVHICNLPEGTCTESDVINLGLPFGKVTNYILMRATNQAFLEMAYPEAAQAMVQFYQQKPPAINEQQLLVRMSKQYKELKLKKPGKNVDSIINDINSQKERDIHKDWDRFPLERPRSRSPLTKSLSPRMESHSPSLTSCSSSQLSSMSPRRSNLSPMAISRGERNNGTERKESRDGSSHKRREEEKDESTAKNYCEQGRDGSDKWGYDRKQHLKPSGRSSPKSLENRGDGYHRHKDKYSKSSLQNQIPSQSKYKIRNEESYKKEQKLKLIRSQHSPQSNGRDSDVHQQPGKRRTSSSQDQTEDKGECDSVTSPAQTDRIHTALEEDERSEQEDETLDSESATWESGSEAEEEAWYSGSMEEFVTVDEVGEEEEHLMEIQLEMPEIKESDCVQTEQDRNMETSNVDLITKETIPDCGHPSDSHRGTSLEVLRLMSPAPSLGSVESAGHCQLMSNLTSEIEQTLRTDVKSPENPAGCKNYEMDKVLSDSESIGHLATEIQCRPGESYETDEKLQKEHFSEEILETQRTDQSVASISVRSLETDELKKESPEAFSKENSRQPIPESAGNNQQLPNIQQPQLPWEQDNVFCNLSIPLGVEFVEARTGFYCKLCGLFYITEDAAKMSHCRSTVHYKNLQKYLSQLAEESLKEGERDRNPGTEEEVGIMPQFESKKSNPS
uniref:RNA-binding protein 20 isoform X2 n=1 Tax=Pristiophorus japonicus TaxID=55135 RepID=UPI00398ED90C